MLNMLSDHLSPYTKAWVALVRGLVPREGQHSLLGVAFGTADPGPLAPQDLRDCLRHGRREGHDVVHFVEGGVRPVDALPIYDQRLQPDLGPGLAAIRSIHTRD